MHHRVVRHSRRSRWVTVLVGLVAGIVAALGAGGCGRLTLVDAGNPGAGDVVDAISEDTKVDGGVLDSGCNVPIPEASPYAVYCGSSTCPATTNCCIYAPDGSATCGDAGFGGCNWACDTRSQCYEHCCLNATLDDSTCPARVLTAWGGKPASRSICCAATYNPKELRLCASNDDCTRWPEAGVACISALVENTNGKMVGVCVW